MVNYENEFATFDEWKKFGRSVKPGEKSYRRNKDGKPVFHKDQTKEFKLFVPRNKALPRSIYAKRYGRLS